jgi:threonylcarbamoyladenosine tRNA methylthiotransferase MtaB
MNQYKKVAFYTLGCKLNFSETSTISRNFEQGGYAKVNFDEAADVYVVNTCSVTDNADKKCRSVVRKAKRNNPNCKIVVIGCYAQLKPDEIVKIDGVDLVLGANEKFNILAHLESGDEQEGGSLENRRGVVINGQIGDVNEFFPSYSIGDRTRTFLKVQDGCDYSCTFCTIPLARGKSRSHSIMDTVKVAKEAIAKGSKEIVLTGVNLGDFGVGTEENFLGLLKALDKLEGIVRLRVSSIEPNLLTDEIIEFAATSKTLVPHFHIPLQSGSPELLRLMRRRYKRELYESRVSKIKKLMPDCCIGVDVIVGFPGETEEKFKETQEFLQKIDVSYFHVFTYSERDDTKAVEMEGVVAREKRVERSRTLQILSAKKKRKFYESHLGKTFPVLWESDKDDNGYIHGFTSNYIKVKTKNPLMKTNTVQEIKLIELDRDGIYKHE